MEQTLYEKVAVFFADKSQQLASFLAIEKVLESIGPVRVEVMKSQISFGTNYKFAWVWLPMKFGADPHGHVRPMGSLVLSFSLDRCIKHDRIGEVVNPYPNRWTHHVIVESPDDLDDILGGWLSEAYNFSNRSRKRSI